MLIIIIDPVQCTFVSQVMICTMYPFQMSLADAKLSFPVHSLTMKRSGEDTSQECKKVHVRLHNQCCIIIMTSRDVQCNSGE